MAVTVTTVPDGRVTRACTVTCSQDPKSVGRVPREELARLDALEAGKIITTAWRPIFRKP